jgi:uncharacterized membrane protein YedE/YeeE
VLRRAPFNTGAALVASGLILIGALYLALTYTWRQAALFLVGAGAGVVLYHAAFGFTSAWRKLIAEGRGDGLRAQMVMLAVTCAVFLPLLADGQVFGRFLRGSVSPVGLSVLIGAFIFGIGMQLGGGCASGTLYSAGGGSVRMHFGIVLGALAAAGLAAIRAGLARTAEVAHRSGCRRSPARVWCAHRLRLQHRRVLQRHRLVERARLGVVRVGLRRERHRHQTPSIVRPPGLVPLPARNTTCSSSSPDATCAPGAPPTSSLSSCTRTTATSGSTCAIASRIPTRGPTDVDLSVPRGR